MHLYSKAAWHIASLYSATLASETRDLAAHIDMAIFAERERCAQIADEHASSECTGMKDQTEAMRLGASSIAEAIRAPGQ